MAKRLSPDGKKALCRFLILLAAAGAIQGMAFLCLLTEGDWGIPLYALCSYVLLPAAAVVVPCWAALGGVHPMAACLPIGGLPFLFHLSPAPMLCLICIVISLVSAVAGQEWKKRRKLEENRNNGRKRKKRA